MSLTHGSFDFEAYNALVGLRSTGPISQPRQEVTFPGVKGVSHIVDERKTRQITIPYTLHNYGSEAALETVLLAIDRQQGEDGTLTQNGIAYQRCTFDGFRHGPIDYSAGGSVGYLVSGQLVFTQRRIG